MEETYEPFPIQRHILFQSDEPDPIRAFEGATRLKVNRSDVQIFQIPVLAKFGADPKQEEKSWWNSGWSHIAFGTVSTAIGAGIVCVASGPIGWATGVLAILGGGGSMLAGEGELLSSDPEKKKLFEHVGDASLSFNNIPGLLTGAGTYVFTGDFDESVEYANYAGLASGGASLFKSGLNALRMQRLFNLEVGLYKTKWSSRIRRINAKILEIDPKGLEASHFIPQRVMKSLVERAPKFQRAIESLLNGPLGIHFMPALSHALVDSHRFRMLTTVEKEILAVTNPLRTKLIENYPKIADALGFHKNLSPTARPVFNGLVITTGRAVKAKAMVAPKGMSQLQYNQKK